MKKLEDLALSEKKYIIFDLDGTLIDSIGIWNLTDQKLIQRYSGVTADLDIIQADRDEFLHNNTGTNIYPAYCEYLSRKYNFTLKDGEELSRIRVLISNEILETDITFKPNVVELISKLKSLGYTLVLATITTWAQLSIYCQKNRNLLNEMNIGEVFDLITTQDNVTHKKPDPEVYNTVLAYYHAKPEECLVFEDSYAGVLASKRANIEVVNIYDKYSDKDRDLINGLADYSIKDYREIIELLKAKTRKKTIN